MFLQNCFREDVVPMLGGKGDLWQEGGDSNANVDE